MKLVGRVSDIGIKGRASTRHPSLAVGNMNGTQTIQAALGSTQWLLANYLEGLSDADLFVRPVPGANHLAWQLGHLISSEVKMVKSQLPEARYPALPAGFDAVHATAAVAN